MRQSTHCRNRIRGGLDPLGRGRPLGRNFQSVISPFPNGPGKLGRSRYCRLLGMAAGWLVLAGGCSIGSPGYLDDYATVGGKWERLNPTHGRVGSNLSDPNADQLLNQAAERVSADSANLPQRFGEATTEVYVDDGHGPTAPGSGYYEYDTDYDSVDIDPESDDSGVIILGDDW